eukprot:9480875-Pyramimonas_sp.AAC.1
MLLLCDCFNGDEGPDKFTLCDRAEMSRELAETAAARINAAARAHGSLVEVRAVPPDKRTNRIRDEALTKARSEAASQPR